MPNAITRIKIAKPDIESYFNKLKNRILRKKDIGKILNENRDFWRLTQRLSPDDFINYLLDFTKLKDISLYAPNYDKTLKRYVWGGKPSVYLIALSIKPNSYFSHYTAMYFHNLTKQIPKTIYLNTEQTKKPTKGSSLEQERINMALKRKARTSNYFFTYDNFNICCHNGKNTDNLGVEEMRISKSEKVPVPSIERTLIDISVRPVYSGGVFEVLNAYKEAKGKFSVNKLLAMLKKIDYIYPYHQVIGFYMQKAEYKDSLLKLVKKLERKYDFYLDYNMKDISYSKEWRLYFPKNY